MAKGVTIILSAIILAAITAAILLSAAYWFILASNEAGRNIEDQRDTDVSIAGKKIRILNIGDAGGSTQIYIKNEGTFAIKSAELTVYLNGVPGSCTWDKETIAPSENITCTMPACTAGNLVKVTAPGNFDVINC